MTEQDLQIPMLDGIADAVFFSPDPAQPLSGVLHLPDIGSIREAHRGMARRLSGEGYAVLLINPSIAPAGRRSSTAPGRPAMRTQCSAWPN